MPTPPDKPSILAVDDDEQVLAQLARDLKRRYGKAYQVLQVSSGHAAIATLDELFTMRQPVALVVSDQRMPDLDGVAVLAHARDLAARRPAGGQTRRVLLTAYADTNAAIAAINTSQVDYYFTKPWDPPEETLYPVLDDLLDDWKASYRPGYGGVRVVGSRWTPRVQEIREFLARHHQPFEFIDLERVAPPDDLPVPVPTDPADLPLVVLANGEHLLAPAIGDLAGRIGLQQKATGTTYDLAIVGGGPAGLAAAVYGASEGLRTVLIEQAAPGGQAGTSSRIENYLGFPSGLSGADLARRALTQARRFDVEVLSPQQVERLVVDGPYKHVSCTDGSTLSSKAVILASGVTWRTLPAEGAVRLAGRGVYYGAATLLPGECADEDVYITGAGNSAGQAALALAEQGARVTLVARCRDLREKMSQYLVDRLVGREQRGEGIRIWCDREVVACHGDESLEALTIRQRADDTDVRVEARALFIFIGARPNTDWLDGVVARDRFGFVLTGADLQAADLVDWPLDRPPALLETSVPGIFAAGDVRHESIKRVASAVGEGSVAVHFVHRYLASL